ncbi:MAG: DALR domain-containing protein, partial [Pseudomonadota bacterium]
ADLVATIEGTADDEPYGEVVDALADDLNTPRAISILHGLAKSARRGSDEKARALKSTLAFLGVLDGETRDDIAGTVSTNVDPAAIDALIAERLEARARKDFATSDRIRDELAAQGIRLKDGKDPETGAPVTTWEAEG